MLSCCVGPKEEIGHYHETIGEALQGVELEFSGLDISFKGTVHICVMLWTTFLWTFYVFV